MSRPATAADAWLTDGAPWWDVCASCSHFRWTHFDGPCDRNPETLNFKRCPCKTFVEGFL